MNSSGHEPLPKLEDAFVQVNNLLTEILLKVNTALLEIEEKQFSDMLVDCSRLNDVTVINNIFKRLEELAVRIQPKMTMEKLHCETGC